MISACKARDWAVVLCSAVFRTLPHITDDDLFDVAEVVAFGIDYIGADHALSDMLKYVTSDRGVLNGEAHQGIVARA